MVQKAFWFAVACGLFLSAFSGVSPASNLPSGQNWSLESAGKVPYMMYGEMPYFGRFETDNPRLSLDGVWMFAKGDEGESKPPEEGWEPINVPGVWNYLHPDMLHYIGIGWYRLRFHVDKGFRAKRYRFHFGGVNMRCRVWLNGQLLGSHEGGYTAFSLDATEALERGDDNTLLVRVDNSMTFTSVPPLNYEDSRMGWFEYGGIHRSVYLEAHPAVTVFKAAVRTLPLEKGNWKLSVDTLVWDNSDELKPGEVSFEAEVISKRSGHKVLKLESSEPFTGQSKGIWGVKLGGKLQSPSLWSPENPYNRYTLKISLHERGSGSIMETIQTDFGFKHFEATPDGLFLNGKPYYIRGLNRHEDDPVTGLTETPDVLVRDIRLLESMNINHMRPGHYPNDPELLDLTDIHGIGITEEIPLYQAGMGFLIWFRDRIQRSQDIGRMHFFKVKPSQFTEPELVGNAVLSLVEMIESDRNHPSVLAWSIGNENWTFTKDSCSTYETLRNVAKEFDPDRPVTFALLQTMWPLKEKCAHIADFISVNEYFGWYVGKVEDVRDYLKRVHERYPDKPIVISEFGAGSVMNEDRIRDGRQDGMGTFDPEEQARIIARQWEIFRELPFVWGGMPWVFADFRNAWFKEEHPIPYFNLKGVLTYYRIPKPAYYVLKNIYKDLENNPPPWAKKKVQ